MHSKNLLILFIAFLVSATGLYAQVTPGDTIHAANYVIELEDIDMNNQTIQANTLVTVVSLEDNLPFIQLQLMDLTVDSVFLNDQKTLDYTHLNNVITVQLPTPINLNDTVYVQVFYHGHPFHESWGGFHFSGDYAFNLGVGISHIPHNLGQSWFPCIDDFTDRATYEVKATVPDHMKAIGGGELIEYTDNGNGTHTFRWYIGNRIPTYLASIAIGEYEEVTDTYSGLERDIPISYWVYPNLTQYVPGTFARIHEVMALFEDRFGPYDWHRIGYVTTEIGAMEHAANIAIPDWFLTGTSANETTIMHELSHMWFGDKVTCDKAEEMWINEGWATFCQYYYKEALDGVGVFKEAMRDEHSFVLFKCHSEENGYHPMNNIPQQYTYGTSAYYRGATKVQAMRAYLGDDVFFPACHAYVDDLAFGSLSSVDMEGVFTINTGVNMEGFFNNWIYNGGTPGYTIDSINTVQNGGNWDVSVYVKQRRHGPAFTGDGNIIEFNVMAQDWTRFNDTIHFDGETGHTTVSVPFEPFEVFLDLDERYMDATIDNYQVITESGEYEFPETYFEMTVSQLIDSVFIQATHNYTPTDTFDVAIPGLKLSDYRFWTIKGVFGEDFSASGSFEYNLAYLDNTLITSPYDSLVIFYRKDAGMEWEQLDFVMNGNWSHGTLVVDNMQMGDYVLGIWEEWVSTEENNVDKDAGSFNVFPNPSSGKFSFSINKADAGRIEIYSLDGKQIESIKISEGNEQINWTPENIPAGSYLGVLKNRNGEAIESKKLLYK